MDTKVLLNSKDITASFGTKEMSAFVQLLQTEQPASKAWINAEKTLPEKLLAALRNSERGEFVLEVTVPATSKTAGKFMKYTFAQIVNKIALAGILAEIIATTQNWQGTIQTLEGNESPVESTVDYDAVFGG